MPFAVHPLWLAAAALLALWLAYGSAYAAFLNARHPPRGRFLRERALKLHVIESGEGPSVLLLHGASANAGEFDRLAERLDGLRVLQMDRPGHGHSRALTRQHELRAHAEAIARAIELLSGGPMIVAAHSLGCATALRLALDRPELVSGLVLASPASHPFPGHVAWHSRLAGAPVIGPIFCRLFVPIFGPLFSQNAVASTFAPARAPENYAREAGLGLLFRPKTFRANGRELAAAKRQFEQQYYRYDEIQVPIIVITGDLDGVVSPRIHARALARIAPKAELVIAPGVGHMPHHVRPEVLSAAIKRLAGIGGAG